jgi:hypothetical protein
MDRLNRIVEKVDRCINILRSNWPTKMRIRWINVRLVSYLVSPIYYQFEAILDYLSAQAQFGGN